MRLLYLNYTEISPEANNQSVNVLFESFQVQSFLSEIFSRKALFI